MFNPSNGVRRVIVALAVLLGVLILALGGVYGYSTAVLNAVSSAPTSPQQNIFDGTYLLTVSDADMVGTAYADDVLMQVPGERDTLTIVDLPLDPSAPQLTEVFASNSVTSWPQVLDVSPDGERAYVVETAGEISDDIEIFPNVQRSPPNGRSLTVVDLATSASAVYDVMDYVLHVDVHPEERYVAVGSGGEGEQLGVLPVATLDDSTTYQFFGVQTAAGAPSLEITSVNWHPSGDYLAVGVDRSELLFYAVEADDSGAVTLRQHGERLTLGNTISYGQFTPDGRHYLTTEINWGAAPGVLGYVLNPPGDMISVAFDVSEAGAHTVTSRVAVGQSPEGFAVSPDASLIVTVDMRRTYLPDNLAFIPGTDLNSLSLLTFDNETGALALVEQYGFEGVLPEHAAFDADGDALAVVVYNDRENPMADGYIEFWDVTTGDTPQLTRTDLQLPVARGPHTMALVP